MIQAGIFGGSGYTGQRLSYYLSRHPQVEIAFITSRQDEGRPISELYGSLGHLCDIKFSDPQDIENIHIDVLFSCAPDQTSMKVVPRFFDKGITIVDLAGDFRMDSAEAYQYWYGEPHVSPEYIERAVYGLTEIYRNNIRESKFISNPGCYPTSVILGLYPLLREGLAVCDSVHVNSASGISGAGRTMKMFKHFYETDSNVMPYKLGRSHKHVGEIEQELSKIAGESCLITFAPHVVPMKTGIVSTILVTLKKPMTKTEIDKLYSDVYGQEYFIRYHRDSIPESKFVADTNFCDIGISLAEGTDKLIIVSTICNLGKGAAGQAVQNMNVMFGFDERDGLL
jgi:N-acetyl-gamma-glutamyl-phosphate reductase